MLLLLLYVLLMHPSEGGICAGCPMEQNITPAWTSLGRKTFNALQKANTQQVLGYFSSITNVKSQVVAGTFFTFVLQSTLDENLEVKLFRSLPDSGTPRKVTYEVSYAILTSSPLHTIKNDQSLGGEDLVIAPEAEEVANKPISENTTPLETRGASWSDVIDEENPGVRRLKNSHSHSLHDDPCKVRTDNPSLPCQHVPFCKDGNATVNHFKLTNVPGDEAASEQTQGTICWDATGIKVTEMAVDSHVLAPWTHCNDPVFQKSSVLEIFVAPVTKVTENPQWYFELDTAPSGALWGGLSNNSRGNSSVCVSSDGCTSPGLLACSGLASFKHELTSRAFNLSTGWGIEINIPFAMFAPTFQPTTQHEWTNRSEKNMATGRTVVVPHSTWRMNFYRYSYPTGPNKAFDNYELSGWSSTHDPSFHVPDKFGVIVLDSAV